MGDQSDIFDAAGLGMQQTGVRQTNQRAIFTLIAKEPGLSAAELARRSRLAPQTVSAILDDLDRAQLLRRGEVLRGRRGQPATPIYVNAQGAYTIGIELGWRHVEAVLVNLAGETIGHYHRDYSFPDPRTLFNELGAVSRQLTEKLPEGERSKLFAVGLAAPSLERNLGLLGAPDTVGERWRELDLQMEAERAIDLPVQVVNDGNAACWAELMAQPQPRPSNFTYLTIGTFIGAGIVAEGTLWEGPTGNSANLGSMMVVDRHGDLNFLHLLGSIYALEQRLAGADLHVPPTTPLFWPWDEWEPHVSDWIAESASAIAKVLLNTGAVIEVENAVIDGVMPSDILDRLIGETRAAMATLPTLTFNPPSISRGHLGGTAAATGAAFLPLYRRFFARYLAPTRANAFEMMPL